MTNMMLRFLIERLRKQNQTVINLFSSSPSISSLPLKILTIYRNTDAISPLFPSILLQFHLRSAVLFFQRLLNGGSRRRSIIGRREQRGVGGGIGKDSFIWQIVSKHKFSELRNMDGMGSIGTGSRECNPSRGNLKSLFPAVN
ncbi:uncharacterized protein LOC111458000 [Cucurbita moschata]|uniref:Uncharacterized protein LOC111458000 n=1 Tax=Cucurbita moschata TaxID=3662 RepID=A0A6J1GWA2_CUCMO|nr:uncharacterized protein LOC111458000 [Cucurbita moschata]